MYRTGFSRGAERVEGAPVALATAETPLPPALPRMPFILFIALSTLFVNCAIFPGPQEGQKVAEGPGEGQGEGKREEGARGWGACFFDLDQAIDLTKYIWHEGAVLALFPRLGRAFGALAAEKMLDNLPPSFHNAFVF